MSELAFETTQATSILRELRMEPATITTVPENYAAYVQLCDRKGIKPLGKIGFDVQLNAFLDQVSADPRGDRGAQIRTLMTRLGLENNRANEGATSHGAVERGADESSPLEFCGPPTSRPGGPTEVNKRLIFKSPINLNLNEGKIECLDPNRTLEAVGRMPSELMLGGKLFVIHRGSANQLDDFRVDIGDAGDLVSYPGRPMRTASGELSVEVQGIGTFQFPFAQERYTATGMFIEAGTGMKSDFPKVIRPESRTSRDQWPHLRHLLRNIERD